MSAKIADHSTGKNVNTCETGKTGTEVDNKHPQTGSLPA